jgi:hypothetical protein
MTNAVDKVLLNISPTMYLHAPNAFKRRESFALVFYKFSSLRAPIQTAGCVPPYCHTINTRHLTSHFCLVLLPSGCLRHCIIAFCGLLQLAKSVRSGLRRLLWDVRTLLVLVTARLGLCSSIWVGEYGHSYLSTLVLHVFDISFSL